METIEVAEAPTVETSAPETVDSAPSTDIDYSTVSDDDILDGAYGNANGEGKTPDQDAAQDHPEPVESKPVTTPKDLQLPKDKQGEKTEEQLEEYEPESLAKLYANPEIKAKLDAVFKAHPEARRAWFRNGQIGDMFQTVAEAREFRQLFPTLDTAKHASEAAAVIARMDQTYMSNPKQFAENLAKGNPNAFASMVAESREVLYKANPDAYARTIGEPVAAEALLNCEEWAQQNNDEPFMAAINILRDRLNIAGLNQPGRPAQRHPAEVELAKWKEAAQQSRNDDVRAFEGSANQGYWDGLRTAVDQAIGKPAGMSDKAAIKVKSEIFNAVADQVANQKNLRPIFEQLVRSGDMSEANRTKAVNYILGYAKQILGPIARSHMQEWTNEILRANKAEVARVAAQPPRRDVGSGSGEARNTGKKPGNGKINYATTSDDDILEGRF